MKHLLLATTFAITNLVSQFAFAQVTVKDPWVRPTVAQQKVTGAFMQLTANQDLKLVAISSTVAERVEIHTMEMDKDVMKMREVGSLDLPNAKTIELKPGSFHMMLMGLKKPIKEGDTINLTLHFESKDKKQQTQEVKAVAKNMGNKMPDAHAGHKM